MISDHDESLSNSNVNDPTYIIIHELTYGGQSTIWLRSPHTQGVVLIAIGDPYKAAWRGISPGNMSKIKGPWAGLPTTFNKRCNEHLKEKLREKHVTVYLTELFHVREPGNINLVNYPQLLTFNLNHPVIEISNINELILAVGFSWNYIQPGQQVCTVTIPQTITQVPIYFTLNLTYPKKEQKPKEYNETLKKGKKQRQDVKNKKREKEAKQVMELENIGEWEEVEQQITPININNNNNNNNTMETAITDQLSNLALMAEQQMQNLNNVARDVGVGQLGSSVSSNAPFTPSTQFTLSPSTFNTFSPNTQFMETIVANLASLGSAHTSAPVAPGEALNTVALPPGVQRYKEARLADLQNLGWKEYPEDKELLISCELPAPIPKISHDKIVEFRKRINEKCNNQIIKNTVMKDKKKENGDRYTETEVNDLLKKLKKHDDASDIILVPKVFAEIIFSQWIRPIQVSATGKLVENEEISTPVFTADEIAEFGAEYVQDRANELLMHRRFDSLMAAQSSTESQQPKLPNVPIDIKELLNLQKFINAQISSYPLTMVDGKDGKKEAYQSPSPLELLLSFSPSDELAWYLYSINSDFIYIRPVGNPKVVLERIKKLIESLDENADKDQAELKKTLNFKLAVIDYAINKNQDKLNSDFPLKAFIKAFHTNDKIFISHELYSAYALSMEMQKESEIKEENEKKLKTEMDKREGLLKVTINDMVAELISELLELIRNDKIVSDILRELKLGIFPALSKQSFFRKLLEISKNICITTCKNTSLEEMPSYEVVVKEVFDVGALDFPEKIYIAAQKVWPGLESRWEKSELSLMNILNIKGHPVLTWIDFKKVIESFISANVSLDKIKEFFINQFNEQSVYYKISDILEKLYCFSNGFDPVDVEEGNSGLYKLAPSQEIAMEIIKHNVRASIEFILNQMEQPKVKNGKSERTDEDVTSDLADSIKKVAITPPSNFQPISPVLWNVNNWNENKRKQTDSNSHGELNKKRKQNDSDSDSNNENESNIKAKK